ncbi:MAG: cation-translocating P-type ATPase [Cyanobium sp.]|nr:cation-translocating P-type ATPase [Cyanobium sp.]
MRPSSSPAQASAGPAPVLPLLLEIEGMKCAGCVRAVEQRLLAQPGVRQASVNLLTRTAWVGLDAAEPPALSAQDHEAETTDPAAPLIAALAGMGFAARRRESENDDPAESRPERRRRQEWWRHWRQLMVALVLVLFSAAGHLADSRPLPMPLALLGEIRLHALVASLALALPGRPILVSGLRTALAGAPGMDTLVGLGMASAYLASLVALVWPAVGWQCFFNEPVMLLGFVLLGRFLEERARLRTGRALQELARLQPDQALLLLGDGPQAEVRTVRVGALRPGDRLRILPGDRVPVDGRVLAGCSNLDVASLTGEPLPMAAAAGAELAAGSLNLDAPLELEVLRPGATSAVARIIALVEQAQARKAPIQALTDRVAGRFSLAVIALAVATCLFWWLWGAHHWPQVLVAAPAGSAHGLHHSGHRSLGMGAETPFLLGLQLAIAVLVVACPCALGLATPTAITVGSGQAARAGVLFRGGDVIEAAAKLTVVLFDKTGTLTLGRPSLTAISMAAAEVSPEQLVQLAASLENQTRHPLAHALLQRAQELEQPLLPVRDVQTRAGDGLTGLVDGFGLCRVGRPGWLMAAAALPLPPAQQHWLAGQEASGATVVGVTAGQRLLGLLAIEDRLRPDARTSLEDLAAMGLDLGVLSGDRQGAVLRLGNALGLTAGQLAWELLPEQKLERIERARRGASVAMVGDGINDAPALAAADLGIAIGTGTQIAMDTADLVVMGDRLEAIPAALRLARATMAKVRQNLAWAFGYNLVVLPIAAGVLLPGFGVVLSPPLAALLMAMSSITVVVNALLLGRGSGTAPRCRGNREPDTHHGEGMDSRRNHASR